jgi:hypothetical protein
MTQTYSVHYIEGIKEGREWVSEYGLDGISEHLAATQATYKAFGPQSPVGQLLKGEIDFLKNWIKKNGL